MPPTTQQIEFERSDVARSVFGHRDENLKILASELTVDIHARGNQVTVVGDPVDAETASRTLSELYDLVAAGFSIGGGDVTRAANMVKGAPDVRLRDIFNDRIVSGVRRPITPKTLAQKHYVDAIRENAIVFGVGPAGTGKTYLAVAMAVAALQAREVRRIILTRPAVEAGERLGFLPGDLQEKVNPYLRPLYDALHDMMDEEKVAVLLERGIIEIAPLAFMRGRTLNDCFVILDEAQNTTRPQMKMFLTRLGFDSHTVVTGDLTQVDLDRGTRSGLGEAVDLLRDIEGIAVRRFSDVDVVRHPLVRKIIRAYENAADRDRTRSEPQSAPNEGES